MCDLCLHLRCISFRLFHVKHSGIRFTTFLFGRLFFYGIGTFSDCTILFSSIFFGNVSRETLRRVYCNIPCGFILRCKNRIPRPDLHTRQLGRFPHDISDN